MYEDILLNSNNTGVNLRQEETNFDYLFNNLNKDIANVNNFIDDLNNKRKANLAEEQELLEERDKLAQQRIEFENHIKQQRLEIEQKHNQINQYLDTQKKYLAAATDEFKSNMQRSLMELDIEKKEFEMSQSKFQEERRQFELYKRLEVERLQQAQQVFQSEKSQFEKYKEVSNKRIELEKKELEKKCERFKNIVNQFNTNFKPLIDSNNE